MANIRTGRRERVRGIRQNWKPIFRAVFELFSTAADRLLRRYLTIGGHFRNQAVRAVTTLRTFRRKIILNPIKDTDEFRKIITIRRERGNIDVGVSILIATCQIGDYFWLFNICFVCRASDFCLLNCSPIRQLKFSSELLSKTFPICVEFRIRCNL